MSNEEFGNLLDDDVKRIKFDKRISVNKKPDADIDKRIRREAAENATTATLDPLVDAPSKMLEPNDVLSYVRPGVQNGVFKNLRQGKYQIDARLDLHQMVVEQARQSVYQFIEDCIANDVRAALITHGKGEGRAVPALLKSHVNHWLPQLDTVLAFHSAQKWHGSYGATYVLLKKSDKKRAQTQEKNTKKK